MQRAQDLAALCEIDSSDFGPTAVFAVKASANLEPMADATVTLVVILDGGVRTNDLK
jgi:hypothetical protein